MRSPWFQPPSYDRAWWLAERKLTGLNSEKPPVATVGRGLHQWWPPAAGDQAARIHRMLLPPAEVPGRVASGKARAVGRPAAARRREPGDRPGDRLADFADRGSLPVHDAAGGADRGASGKGSGVEAGVAKLHHDAAARDALSRCLAQRQGREA